MLMNNRYKNVLVLFFWILLCKNAVSQSLSIKEREDSLIFSHFNNISMAVKKHPRDTVYYCCPGSVLFLSTISGISPNAPATFKGYEYFTKSIFFKWRSWYLKRYGLTGKIVRFLISIPTSASEELFIVQVSTVRDSSKKESNVI